MVMKISKDALMGVLSQFNPWWQNESIPELPAWRRASFHELYRWVYQPPTHRAILLSGARQVGKTTLLFQVIHTLLKEAQVPAANILYVTFDHPLIKMTNVDAVLEAWREREPRQPGQEYIFLDEAQFIPHWGTWIKHQVDFVKRHQIVFTGSAMPLIDKNQESGVGRWHTIKLTTLSFYEYLQLKKTLCEYLYLKKIKQLNTLRRIGEQTGDSLLLKKSKKNQRSNAETSIVVNDNFWDRYMPQKPDFPTLPPLKVLQHLFDWSPEEFARVSNMAQPYMGHFNQYLIRGGFPQTALIDNVHEAQRLLREDIIDKALKRDMTALFGVRRVIELEQIFLYLCMHDGGLLDMPQLCSNLALQRPTVQRYIELLEAAHLIYRLQPFGYGKEILRAKFKIYLADPAIPSAVLLKGNSTLDNPKDLGIATETAVFKHLFARYYPESIRFTYWRGAKDQEVDLVAETNSQKIPFEIKYRLQQNNSNLKGLLEFCQKECPKYAYVITKSMKDFGMLKNNPLKDTQIMQIPAALLCYWMGEAELSQTSAFD